MGVAGQKKERRAVKVGRERTRENREERAMMNEDDKIDLLRKRGIYVRSPRFSTGICSLIVCIIFKSMFARQKFSFSWITSPHCAKMVPHGSMIYQTQISEKRSGNKRCKPGAMNMLGFPRRAWVIIIGLTDHGAPQLSRVGVCCPTAEAAIT